MASNNPVNTPPVQPAPAPQPKPQPAPIAVPNMAQPGAAPTAGGNKMIFWLVGGLVLIILLAGGVFLFMNRQSAKTANTQTDRNKQTPAPVKDTFEQDLNAIDVATPGAEFDSIDQDLQGL